MPYERDNGHPVLGGFVLTKEASIVMMFRIARAANTIADVNSGRHLDLLVPNNASNTVSVLLDVDHDDFTPAAPVSVNSRVGVEVGGLYGDAHPHFIAATPATATSWRCRLDAFNNGSGGFVADAPGVVT